MANVIKVPAKTETKIIEIEPEKIVLELNEREALIIQCLIANTKWNDLAFPEIKTIGEALHRTGLDYYGRFTVDRTRPASGPIRLIEVNRPQRASTGTDAEWD